VFGFGKGKINIAIQKTTYAPGDIISGNVVLTLKKPVKAREMRISLITEVLETRTVTISSGGGRWRRQQQTSWVQVWDSKQQLDGEKEYGQGGEYRFGIKIPGGSEELPEGFLGGVSTSRRRRWYLLATLDIPGALDINKKVNITIG
jgi:hypothetical protein